MKRYSKPQTCPLVILYSISANSPSKQQGGRHIVIGAMGSVDRVITLGGVGGVGNRRPGSYIYIYIPYPKIVFFQEPNSDPWKIIRFLPVNSETFVLRLRNLTSTSFSPTKTGKLPLEIGKKRSIYPPTPNAQSKLNRMES